MHPRKRKWVLAGIPALLCAGVIVDLANSVVNPKDKGPDAETITKMREASNAQARAGLAKILPAKYRDVTPGKIPDDPVAISKRMREISDRTKGKLEAITLEEAQFLKAAFYRNFHVEATPGGK